METRKRAEEELYGKSFDRAATEAYNRGSDYKDCLELFICIMEKEIYKYIDDIFEYHHKEVFNEEYSYLLGELEANFKVFYNKAAGIAI